MTVYITYAQRTPVGAFLGSLSNIPASKLGEHLIRHLTAHRVVDMSLVNEVILGQVLTGGCGQNPARQALINSGLKNSIPSMTINKVCGSGLKAIALAASAIKNKDADCIIAGGQENMSLSGHITYARAGLRLGDSNLVDTMLKDGLTDAFNLYHMGITAENLAKRYNITREEQDEFAYNSHMKASKAQKMGKFHDEIVPINVTSKKGHVLFDQDEFIRHDTTLDSLKALKPAFIKDNGTVTAGNSSGINDGAAIMLITSESFMKSNNIVPLAKIVSYASHGVDPSIMGIGPVEASKIALSKAGWNIEDVDVWELNEAFAAQSIAVLRELMIDPEKVNLNGGAIAIGHPIGASGARTAVSLIHIMRKKSLRKGVVTLCIGGGMGIAMCIEKC